MVSTDSSRNWDSMVLIYLKVPGVKPDLLEGRQRYIPITCTLSPGFIKSKKRHHIIVYHVQSSEGWVMIAGV